MTESDRTSVGPFPNASERRLSPTQLVADGYDRLHEVYASWSGADQGGLRRRYIDRAFDRGLAPSARALDLGCGTGRHATAYGLRPGGWLIATLGGGIRGGEGIDKNWLGVADLYWSNWGLVTNRRLVAEAGLHLLEANRERQEEDGRVLHFLWVLARKPA